VYSAYPPSKARPIPHRSCNHISLAKFAARSVLHNAGGLNAKHTRELYAGRVSLPGEHLGAIDPEGIHPNQYLPSLRHRDPNALDLQYFRAPWFINHHRFHHRHTKTALRFNWAAKTAIVQGASVASYK
jgi:hypothetical protein